MTKVFADKVYSNEFWDSPPKPTPKRYHYRNDRDSDKDEIVRLMDMVPDERRQEVSDQYGRIFQDRNNGGRDPANEYLRDEASRNH